MFLKVVIAKPRKIPAFEHKMPLKSKFWTEKHTVFPPSRKHRKTRSIWRSQFERKNTMKNQKKGLKRGRREPGACKTRCFLRHQPGNHTKHDAFDRKCSQNRRSTAKTRCFRAVEKHRKNTTFSHGFRHEKSTEKTRVFWTHFPNMAKRHDVFPTGWRKSAANERVFTCFLVKHAKTLGVLSFFDTLRRSRHVKHDVFEKRTLENT